MFAEKGDKLAFVLKTFLVKEKLDQKIFLRKTPTFGQNCRK
jgi:hypothetical protein